MITKVFEIRDRMTFIPVVATSLDTTGLPEEEAWLISKAGFGRNYKQILITKLVDGESQSEYDANDWHSMGRTMSQAHKYINFYFNELPTGSVIDVEYILGETSVCKVSERL